MIFCGDIAIPFKGGISFTNFPEDLLKKDWFGNLEGSLVCDSDIADHNMLNKRIVFNSFEAIKVLKDQINFKAFSLANNHIKDAADLHVTFDNLNELAISHVGAGYDITSASESYLLTSEGVDYAIIAFGWDFIKCVYASDRSEGVNPYTKTNVIKQVHKLCNECNDRRIIVFMHWNYELELYPQPLDREIAHSLIDCGVYAVIGCHAHRVQPVEIYNGRPIIYGLGNFAFRQETYMGGNLNFPSFSYPEIAVEITKDGDWIIHHLEYDAMNHEIKFISSSEMSDSGDISKLTDSEYKVFFSKYRFQKKGLPILYYEDSDFIYGLKKRWVKFRGKVVDLLSKNKKIFNAIKGLTSRVYENN